MCNFFQKSESTKYRVNRIGYPYPVPVSKQILISVSGCKLTILPDIQPANRIVIISAHSGVQQRWTESNFLTPHLLLFQKVLLRIRSSSANHKNIQIRLRINSAKLQVLQ